MKSFGETIEKVFAQIVRKGKLTGETFAKSFILQSKYHI